MTGDVPTAGDVIYTRRNAMFPELHLMTNRTDKILAIAVYLMGQTSAGGFGIRGKDPDEYTELAKKILDTVAKEKSNAPLE